MIEEIRKDAEIRREKAYDRKYGKINACIVTKKDRINKYFVMV